MNELYPIQDAPFCDNCGQLSYNQEQSTEGDWLCPDCVEHHTCYVCGSISLESELRVFDGELVKLCVDCMGEKVNPGVDLSPINEVFHDAFKTILR